MKMSDEIKNEIVLFHLEGKVMGGPDANKFHEKLHEYIDTGNKKVIVNLEKVEWMSSVGLGMLISALTAVRNNGGELKLANITNNIQSLLTITRLATIFEAHDSIDEALAAF